MLSVECRIADCPYKINECTCDRHYCVGDQHITRHEELGAGQQTADSSDTGQKAAATQNCSDVSLFSLLLGSYLGWVSWPPRLRLEFSWARTCSSMIILSCSSSMDSCSRPRSRHISSRSLVSFLDTLSTSLQTASVIISDAAC